MLDRPQRSAPFLSGAPAVSFMQDGTQDRPNVFVQLVSSSDAERIFSAMNDIYRGRSGGTCLQLCPPFAMICTSRLHPSAMKSKGCFCAAHRRRRQVDIGGTGDLLELSSQYPIRWVPMAPPSSQDDTHLNASSRSEESAPNCLICPQCHDNGPNTNDPQFKFTGKDRYLRFNRHLRRCYARAFFTTDQFRRATQQGVTRCSACGSWCRAGLSAQQHAQKCLAKQQEKANQSSEPNMTQDEKAKAEKECRVWGTIHCGEDGVDCEHPME